MTPELEAKLIANIAGLRPWWWWFGPHLYALILEDYLRQTLAALQDERETVVKIPYRR